MNRYIHQSIVTACALALLVGCGGKKKTETPDAAAVDGPVAVTAIVAAQESIVDTVVSSAAIEAQNDVMVVSRGAGTIIATPMMLGMHVPAGAILIAVDDAVQQAGFNQATVGVSSAQMAFDVAQQIFDKGNGSKGELLGAQNGLAAAKAGLEMAKLNLENCATLSPIAGEVAAVLPAVQIGAQIGPGTPIGRVVDISRLKMTVYVGENQIGSIAKGDKVLIAADAADAQIPGTVTAVSAASNAASGAFAVEIAANNTPSRSIKVGMSGSAAIVTGHAASGIPLPLSAIAERNGTRNVWISRSGKAALMPVKLQMLSGGRALIESGINPGDLIITSGLSQLTPNCAVAVTESAGEQK